VSALEKLAADGPMPDLFVPDHLRPWSEPWPDYSPTDITPPELRADGIAASVREGWAEPELDPTHIGFAPRQAEALVPYTVIDGYPRNPTGRTGKTGRNLGRWAENAAADPIVVAYTDTGRQVLLIRRDDCGQWAIPGGMVEPGEDAPAALVRELHEETGVDLTAIPSVTLDRRYIDDPRNSDEAWVCSTVALFRVSAPAEPLAGSDALDARWWPFDTRAELARALRRDGDQLYTAHEPLLFAAHQRLLRDAYEGLRA
jgi:ADP-ribose pyrophosphatase